MKINRKFWVKVNQSIEVKQQNRPTRKKWHMEEKKLITIKKNERTTKGLTTLLNWRLIYSRKKTSFNNSGNNKTKTRLKSTNFFLILLLFCFPIDLDMQDFSLLLAHSIHFFFAYQIWSAQIFNNDKNNQQQKFGHQFQSLTKLNTHHMSQRKKERKKS